FIDLFSFFFSSRRRHTRSKRDWSSDVCSSDLKKTSFSFLFLFLTNFFVICSTVIITFSFLFLFSQAILLHIFKIKTRYSTNYIKDRKSTRLNSSHVSISYAVFCLKKKVIVIHI